MNPAFQLRNGKLLLNKCGGDKLLSFTPSLNDTEDEEPCCCTQCGIIHISVIDEDSSYSSEDRDREWCIFRAAFPKRHFFLLRPSPSFDELDLPRNWDGVGPITVGRPGEGGSDTDWFDVMPLTGKIKPTTRIVLFVDNSGSMTTNTVKASFDAFLLRLSQLQNPITQANGRLVVIAGSSENWICPHLSTFADCVGPGCTCTDAASSSLNIDVAGCGCCCINETFSLGNIVPGTGCSATVYGQRVVTRPPCSGTGPVQVKITGIVDDEFILNGEIIEPGQYPFTPGCNGAHEIGGGKGYSFELTGSSFTIAAGDNHGGGVGYTLKICFLFP